MLTKTWWESLPEKSRETLQNALPTDDEGLPLDKSPAWEALAKLTELNLSYQYELKDVSFLKAFVHLKKLSLSEGSIKDLSVLASLTNLFELDFAGTAVTRIDFLKNLHQLKILILNDGVKNIEVLAELPLLEELTYHGKPFSSLPFTNLKNLKKLDIQYSKKIDLMHLSGLTKLEYLDITGINALQDLNALQTLVNLKVLISKDLTRVKDISALSHLTHLTQLDLGGCVKIKDIQALARLENLEQLSLWNCQGIQEINALSGCTKLRHVQLDYVPISDISAFSHCPDLESVTLSYTLVSDISPLENASNLSEISLSETRISNIEALRNARKLTYLDISQTQVADISPLKHAKNLQSLYLQNTKVAELSTLFSLKKIVSLHIKGTLVSMADADKLESIFKTEYYDYSRDYPFIFEVEKLNEAHFNTLTHLIETEAIRRFANGWVLGSVFGRPGDWQYGIDHLTYEPEQDKLTLWIDIYGELIPLEIWQSVGFEGNKEYFHIKQAHQAKWGDQPIQENPIHVIELNF